MKEKFPDCVLLHGPQGNGTDFDKHTAKVPLALPVPMRDPTVAVICRNPFDRAVSLWKHFVRYGKRDVTFEWYVERILTSTDRWWFFRFTIMQTLEGTHFDKVIRFESLLNDLQSLGVELPTLQKRHMSNASQAWDTFYTPATRDAVRRWAEEDFSAFGYDPTALDHLS